MMGGNSSRGLRPRAASTSTASATFTTATATNEGRTLRTPKSNAASPTKTKKAVTSSPLKAKKKTESNSVIVAKSAPPKPHPTLKGQSPTKASPKKGQAPAPIQTAFAAGEKVLCFEPDPTKVKVIYDARIMKAELAEDGTEQYLVHFQGWSSTWDRYVARDLLLPVDDNSRRMQAGLVQEAKDAVKTVKKNKRRRLQLLIGAGGVDSEEGDLAREEEEVIVDGGGEASLPPKPITPESTPQPAPRKVAIKGTPQGEGDASGPLQIPVPLSTEVKAMLDRDHDEVVGKGRLHRLPAGKPALRWLEDFVRHYGAERLTQHERRHHGRGQPAHGPTRETPAESFERLQRDISICKEVAEGVRVLLDFYLNTVLLYPNERKQYEKFLGGCKKFDDYWTLMQLDINLTDEKIGASSRADEDEDEEKPKLAVASGISGATRSRCNSSLSDSASRSSPPPSLSSSGGAMNTTGTKLAKAMPTLPSSSATADVLRRVLDERERLGSWTLMPAALAEEGKGRKPIASMVYGGVFLLRLFVKMPLILGGMNPTPKRAKMLIRYFIHMMDFLEKNIIISDVDYEKSS